MYADDTTAFTIGDSTDERKTFCLTKSVAGVNQKGDDPAGTQFEFCLTLACCAVWKVIHEDHDQF